MMVAISSFGSPQTSYPDPVSSPVVGNLVKTEEITNGNNHDVTLKTIYDADGVKDGKALFHVRYNHNTKLTTVTDLTGMKNKDLSDYENARFIGQIDQNGNLVAGKDPILIFTDNKKKNEALSVKVESDGVVSIDISVEGSGPNETDGRWKQQTYLGGAKPASSPSPSPTPGASFHVIPKIG